MSASPGPLPQEMRTNNLALAFQELFTVILRTRFQAQRVEDAEVFRAGLRKMISGAVHEASSLGYSDEAAKMAVYAIIAFLDESVLSSQDPAFANWSKRPMQEEMFGGHFAGEYFFRNVGDLINKPESTEVADLLELHSLCLLLGYRGRYAFGNPGEVQALLMRMKQKIDRIRGMNLLFRPMEPPPPPRISRRDPWVRRLAISAIVLAVVTLLAYFGYIAVLGQGAAVAASRPAATSPEAPLSLFSPEAPAPARSL